MRMQAVASSLEGKQGTYGDLMDQLESEGFVLANWEYDGGYFDRKLDDAGQVFLRLPIAVREGELDNREARVEFGRPFVLKHVYRTGNDPDIGYMGSQVIAPLMNQFQEPVDNDASIEPQWIAQAEEVLRLIELEVIF
ncbi:YugN family protein [Brevibacillus ginsengisoli]|uniref:YugN family protein n=1 Tax=Brevibacillus ginsengisoli TaxID=363854 RepID=UPI003CF20847